MLGTAEMEASLNMNKKKITCALNQGSKEDYNESGLLN
jgi:hypothetical protein